MNASTVGESAYFIDMDAIRALGRSFESMLLERCCDDCRESIASDMDELSPREVMSNIVKCCSQREDFITSQMPLLEVAFRVLIARGNEPIGLKEFYHIVAEEYATPLNPRNVTIDGFRRILARDRYYGLRPRQVQR
jgi:hypothetical protein